LCACVGCVVWAVCVWGCVYVLLMLMGDLLCEWPLNRNVSHLKSFGKGC
jgi:hypothetical protein